MRQQQKIDEGMRRRDALKVLGGIPAAMAAASAVSLSFNHAHSANQGAKVAYVPKFFREHEWKTAGALADMIIPRDEGSGSASEAGAVDYVDEYAAYKGEELQTELRGGLMWLDHECNGRFGKDFIDCSPEQKKQVLDLIAFPEKSAPYYTQAAAFFDRFRDLTADGFYTSKMGIADLAYMGNEAYDWQGCPAEVLHKLGLK